MHRRSLILLTILLGLSPQTPLYADQGKTARVIHQKLMLLDDMINKSKKAKAIAASESNEAKELLAQARELIAIARTTFYEGDQTTAEQAVNDALNSFDTAKLLLTQAGGLGLRESNRYQSLRKAITSMQGGLSENGNGSFDKRRVARLLEEAEQLGQRHNYAEANLRLEEAYQMLLTVASSDYQSDVEAHTLEMVSPATGDASTLVERSRYRELQQAISAFRGRLSAEQQATIDNQRLDALVAEAEQLTQQDHYRQANRRLNEAYQIVVAAVSGGYTGNTVVYSLDFATPEAEYEYERQRFQGNHTLVQTLLQQRPDSPSNSLVNRYVEQAIETRDQARQQAESGAHDQALATMEEAARQLKRAMGMLGLRF